MKALKVFLSGVLVSALPVLADVYQWTDENGKVHFSDKPPANQSAENITDITKPINIESNTTEREKIRDIFAPLTEEEQRYQEQEAQGRTREQLRKQQQCAELRKRLNFFQTQRFYWVDDSGKETNATEAERQEAISALQKAINDKC